MTIMEIFNTQDTESKAYNSRTNAATNAVVDQSFDSLFTKDLSKRNDDYNKAQQNQATVSRDNDFNQRQQGVLNAKKQYLRQNSKAQMPDSSDVSKAEDAEIHDKTVEAETVENVDTAAVDANNVEQETSEQLNEKLNEKLVCELAEIFNLPKEEVANILASLNLQPSDLTDKGNLNTFLQAVCKVSTPAQLLNVPNLSQKLESVSKALDEFVESAKLLNDFKQVLQTIETKPPTMEQTETPVDATKTPEPVKIVGANLQNKLLVEPLQPQETKQAESVPLQPIVEAEENPTNQGSNGNQQDEQEILKPIKIDALNLAKPIETANLTFAKEVVKATSNSNINTADVVEQIVDKMKFTIKGDFSEIRVNLKPEHLGDVSLKVSTLNGIVTAQFVAENQRIKEIIEQNFNQLKDTLNQQGLQVSELSVSVGQDKNQQMMNQFQQQQNDGFTNFQRQPNLGNLETIDVPLEAIDTKALNNNSVEYTA